MSRARLALLAALALPVGGARADGYRLRGDALVQARQPSGALILSGCGEVTRELGVEVYLWGDLRDDPEADLLVAALSYVDAQGHGELRAGRLLVTSGALRPVHLDGLSVLGRLDSGTSLQLFGGMPAVPRLGERTWDWAVGARLAQELGPVTLGAAYLMQRDAGQLAAHELGVDLAVFPAAWLDVGARAALDLVDVALAQLVVNTAATLGPVRATVAATHRSPAHLLPATSLFSVLGDRGRQSVDGRLDWRVAPRLTLSAAAGARLYDDRPYEDATVGAELRLGPSMDSGLVGLDLRRAGAPGGGWTGARAWGRVPVHAAVDVSAEVELVHADAPGDRGELWPWALLAITWRPHPSWELAAAAEASVTPQAVRAFDGLVRASYQWSGP